MLLSSMLKRPLARLCRLSYRVSSTAPAGAVGCFSAVHVAQHNDMPSLLSRTTIHAGEMIFQFTGVLLDTNTGDRCLQVGHQHWLTPGAEEGEPPWVFLNHSFEPTVHLSHLPLDSSTAALKPPILTATANMTLTENAPLTIDYTLHEYKMFGDGFVCSETDRSVRGFHFLTDKEQEEILSKAAHHIQSLHDINMQ
jgi:hypothetical protein|tara:strand:+ start:52 stop:639 length:588 start_codon:yes stop_codon:yes gene_type:complete